MTTDTTNLEQALCFYDFDYRPNNEKSKFSAPCELLCLKKRDFEIVLKDTVMEEWDKVIAAMKRFRYFDKWDEVAQRECCIRSKIKKYIPDQTILGDGSGYPTYTYFVLKGHCVLIEHMYLRVETKNGLKSYQLLESCPEPPQTVEEGTTSTIEKTSKSSKVGTERKFVSIKEEEPTSTKAHESYSMRRFLYCKQHKSRIKSILFKFKTRF